MNFPSLSVLEIFQTSQIFSNGQAPNLTSGLSDKSHGPHAVARASGVKAAVIGDTDMTSRNVSPRKTFIKENPLKITSEFSNSLPYFQG